MEAAPVVCSRLTRLKMANTLGVVPAQSCVSELSSVVSVLVSGAPGLKTCVGYCSGLSGVLQRLAARLDQQPLIRCEPTCLDNARQAREPPAIVAQGSCTAPYVRVRL